MKENMKENQPTDTKDNLPKANKIDKKNFERKALILLLSSILLFFMPLINLITMGFEDGHINSVGVSGYGRLHIFVSNGQINWFYDLVAYAIIVILIIAAIGFAFFFFSRPFIENKKIQKLILPLLVVQVLCTMIYLGLGIVYLNAESTFDADSHFTFAFIPLIISSLLLVFYFIKQKNKKIKVENDEIEIEVKPKNKKITKKRDNNEKIIESNEPEKVGKIEETIIDETVLDKPAIEEPVTEKPLIQEPLIEKPILEEPIDKSTTDESEIAESTIHESTVEIKNGK